MLKWLLTGALGRDPEIIDSNLSNENIFAVTDKAMSIKKGNNAHYYNETPSERESEEEKRIKKQLELDSKKLRNITPRDFARKGLGNKDEFVKKFKELDEETRKKVLEDPREFIY
jgi:DNA-directed RNA polymerase subunit H (RpoH/RPB5)